MSVTPIPAGLCQCGCGQRTPLAKRTVKHLGLIGGQPVRFLNGHHPSKGPADVRFWRGVEKTDGCWLWRGRLRPNGYGYIDINDRKHSAHRFAWTLVYGPIPDGLEVLHKCDVPACVRPDHLFLGTQAENIADRDRKGRNLTGERSHRAKLTDDQVKEILAADRRRGYQRQLARKFGVSKSTIGAVVRGQNWKRERGAA